MNKHFIQRMACPGCECSRHQILYSCPYCEPPINEYLRSFYKSPGVEFEYLQGASYTLFQCSNCGLIYQAEIPTDFLLKKLYEEWIGQGKTGFRRSKGVAFTRIYLQEVMTFVQMLERPPQQIKVLDFGMGWGHWSLVARAFGCQVSGYELSKKQIDYARSQGIEVVTWDEIPKRQFDFINCEQVFEHLDEPLPVLKHLRRGLAPNGLLKIGTPDGSDIPRKLEEPDWKAGKYSKASMNKVSPLEHINCFNPTAILAMAAKAGLRQVHVPLRVHYASLVNWAPPVEMLRNLIIPLYRKINPRRTSFLFRPA